MQLRFHAPSHPTVGVVRLGGRLDLIGASEFKARVQGLVSAGYTQLVVDLQDVEDVDSSGLCALVSSLSSARQAGGEFRVASARASVQALFRQCCLDTVLPSYASVEDALVGYP